MPQTSPVTEEQCEYGWSRDACDGGTAAFSSSAAAAAAQCGVRPAQRLTGVAGKGCACDNTAKWESGETRQRGEGVSCNFDLVAGQCWSGQVVKCVVEQKGACYHPCRAE